MQRSFMRISEDSDQTELMHLLICCFVGCTCQKGMFSHVAAQFIMNQLLL